MKNVFYDDANLLLDYLQLAIYNRFIMIFLLFTDLHIGMHNHKWSFSCEYEHR